jgi:4-amino-4-deoxychorismate lyase
MLYCSVNYQQVNTLSVVDRGLAYGDGLFTTAKVIDGKIAMLAAHLERLKSGCLALALEPPNFAQLAEQLNVVADKYSLAVLKVIITSGIGGRGYSRHGVGKATVIISLFEFPQHYINWQQQGISLGLCKLKLGLNPMLAGIKHLNRLEQVLIRQELDLCAEDDLVVLDINNRVISASCGNIFWHDNGQWHTPKIVQAGIAGLMRAKILAEIANIEVVNANLSDLNTAQAMFICNSVMGIVPIRVYNQQQLSLNTVNLLINKLL